MYFIINLLGCDKILKYLYVVYFIYPQLVQFCAAADTNSIFISDMVLFCVT